MDQVKPQSKLPALVTLVAVGLLIVYCDTQHLCHLQSIVIEVPLLVVVVWACYHWTACAKTSGQAWVRTGLALALALAIEMTYLTWLHSDFFPRALLSPKTIASQISNVDRPTNGRPVNRSFRLSAARHYLSEYQ
jgi:hypothetical protein